MIPRKIHYCWFGRGEKPKIAQKCIASWKKNCPDYEIIEWNEDNFDLDYNAYTRYCYDNKKYAFLSDFVRLVVLSEQGGIYLDTDVEVVKGFEEYLQYEAFYGFETKGLVNTGLGFGTIPHQRVIEALKEPYLALKPDEKGEFVLQGCPILNTQVLNRMGLQLNGMRQNICGAEILPGDHMNPYEDATGRLNKTVNTISIHWYSKSWISKKMILRSKLTKPFHRLFGINCFEKFKKK